MSENKHSHFNSSIPIFQSDTTSAPHGGRVMYDGSKWFDRNSNVLFRIEEFTLFLFPHCNCELLFLMLVLKYSKQFVFVIFLSFFDDRTMDMKNKIIFNFVMGKKMSALYSFLLLSFEVVYKKIGFERRTFFCLFVLGL